ncbi:hypothetical protein XMA152_001033 [Marinobacterium sp. xm-a-152]|nr:hypothetical protein [Marinobacterium sp. xm-a-152]
MLFLSSAASASDYGTSGLIDTPNARMRSDGEFSVTTAHDRYAQSYSLSYQILPSLEGTFRYTGLNDFFYWDRNYELKLSLLEESKVLPALSVGIRDMLGTGVYSSEYVVGSKRFNEFDLSLGFGWGRLAGSGVISNPMVRLHPSFANRSKDVGKGGTFSLGEWFSGENVGLFGGIQYRPDWAPITVNAEYNPDQYRWEVRNGSTSPTSPLSYGLDWEFTPGYTIGLSHQHGDSFGLSFSASFDTKENPAYTRPSPLIPELKQVALRDDQVPEWYLNTTESILRAGVVPASINLVEEDGKAEVVLRRGAYQYWPDAINSAHAQAVAELPSDVRNVDYLINEAGMNIQTVRLPKPNSEFGLGEVRFPDQASLLPARPTRDDAYELSDTYTSGMTVSAFVDAKYHLFDPDNPLGFELYAGLGSAVPLFDGWYGLGIAEYSLVDNLDGNTRVSDSVLPHVRSDASKYLKNSPARISVLKAEKRGTLNSNLHYRLFGGVLETMYSGAGAELLYQPYHSRLAFGLSGAYAKQRDYEGLFGHFDYDVFTGHASLFWATPFYNYDAAFHLGRYLAKDIGGTLEVRRTFENGWSLGLWATLTDVPFDTFGEGSFDKGIYLQIPFNMNITGGVGSGFNARVRPIQRDGGARLEGYSGQLWWDTRAARADVFMESTR